MRSLSESTERWQQTLKHSSSFAQLQQAVQGNGSESPCSSGCRSICWKAFLLNQTANTANWSHALREARSSYSSFRAHFLKYINHPEYLNAGSLDPLTDDPDSPWNTLRHDQTLRAEILQDVERLPDVPFYHEDRIQTMILDIIFIYCKLNPDVGGYRQGMHELLAPIVYVVEQDAIDPAAAATQGSAELMMVEMLDASFVEHDSFSLFAKVMENAKGFYEVNEGPGKTTPTRAAFGTHATRSSIVEKSMYIHEVCLQAVDPELAMHLTTIEILPQIFLIRWVRLLFSREFPFEQMLVLWDTIFSVDPTFKLIDLICTAMLVRIRWDLLEADYSGALQLLLRYPSPEEPHGPHTFLDDAIYLREHLNYEGGASLIQKYTGRRPAPKAAGPELSPPTTPSPRSRPRLRGPRSTLSPARFMSPQGGMEALLQGAAKNVFERGEKLGINQAVRDAMEEIRRNVTEAKSSMLANRDIFTDPGEGSAARAVALLDRRNQELADMVGDVLSSLKDLAISDLNDGQKQRDTLEVAIARLDVIKIYLEDSTMALPEDIQTRRQNGAAKDTKAPLNETIPQEDIATASKEDQGANNCNSSEPSDTTVQPATSGEPAKKEVEKAPQPTEPAETSSDPLGSGATTSIQQARRPQAPNPTRSSIAQSSFAWMLEPDQSSTSAPAPLYKKSSSPAPHSHRKRPSTYANRERTAFLFGDVSPGDSGDGDGLPDDLFGLKTLRKSRE